MEGRVDQEVIKQEMLDIVTEDNDSDLPKRIAESLALLGAARQDAMVRMRGHQRGPGKRGVYFLHKQRKSKPYANARPFSHPKREKWTAEWKANPVNYNGTGYLGMKKGEYAMYFKPSGRTEIFAGV
jgi:hypothetical protein